MSIDYYGANCPTCRGERSFECPTCGGSGLIPLHVPDKPSLVQVVIVAILGFAGLCAIIEIWFRSH